MAEPGLARLTAALAGAGLSWDQAFLDGYRGNGGAVTFDIAARRRLSLYRAYLYLIMWVETAPRGFGQELVDRIYGRVFQPLATAFRGSPS